MSKRHPGGPPSNSGSNPLSSIAWLGHSRELDPTRSEPASGQWRLFNMNVKRAIAGTCLVLVLMFVAGCGDTDGSGQTVSTNPRRESIAAAAVARPGRLVEVVAPVFYWSRTGQQIACLTILQSLPAAGCGGVPVKGYDFERVEGVIHFGEAVSRLGNAGWQTPPLRLVGRWNGQELIVKRVSLAGSSPESPAPPARCDAGQTTRSMRRLAGAITAAQRRIHLLELDVCRTNVWLLVPLADARTSSYLTKHFGGRIIVASWLRPLVE